MLGSACRAAPAAPGLSDSAGPTEVQVAVAANEFLPGAPRVPFVLFDGAQEVADAQAVQVFAYDLAAEARQPAWSGAAVSYSDYDIPYWVVYPELPRPGYWGLGLQITRAGGAVVNSQFTLEVVADVASPQVGEVPPASRNRTLAGEPDIHKLSSDPEPVPALYQMTVAEALQSGRPSVVVFGTPAFCTSRLCGPVVDSVEAVQRAHPQGANYIHLEVYQTFDPLVVASEMDEWHLTSEPWVFVLDRAGKVAARLGGPVSERELTAVLIPLVNP